MDASEIYSKRLNVKEVIFPKQGDFIFPIADGRIKTPGGDQELRTSTLVRPRPIQRDGHIDFLGESEGSLPQPHDSLPDAGEAIHDFWSMSGSFIYRHHVEPRVKLYSPREESFPIPLKYIDVTRTTHTNLDVKQEKRIDDYWNIDGSRDLSDPWTGFTQFTLLDEKPPDGYTLSGGRLTRKQLTSRPDHLWPESWKSMGKHAKLKEKQKWSEEKIHLENARKLRGIYFIDPEDTEFKETIKNARKKLETSVAPAIPCKIMKNCGSDASINIMTKLACILEADDVRGVSWSEVATVPKRKSHKGLDLNFSWNSEEDIWKGRKKSNGTKKKKETGEEKQPQRNAQVHMHGWDDSCKADLSHRCDVTRCASMNSAQCAQY